MKISTIVNTDSHELKLYIFTAKSGRLAPSFFQFVDKQGKFIGCRDSYDAALEPQHNSPPTRFAGMANLFELLPFHTN